MKSISLFVALLASAMAPSASAAPADAAAADVLPCAPGNVYCGWDMVNYYRKSPSLINILDIYSELMGLSS